MNQDSDQRIELRSEKVRRIVGAVPSRLIGWNMAVIVIILLALLLVVCFVPYPYGDGESIIQHIVLIQVPHTLSLRNLDYSLCDTL